MTATRPRPIVPLRRRIAAVVLLGTASVVAVAVVYVQADVSTVGRLSFDNPVNIPDLAEGEPSPDGSIRTFELDVQTGFTRLIHDTESETWGVNGAHLGPTIRVRRGEKVEMRVTNNLPETTTMHWHGMHLPAYADGGPHQPIGEGRTWSPSWIIDQPAATLWYHPHPHGATERHVYRGVAGMLIIDDDIDVELPEAYGIDDIPLIIQDIRVDNGRLSESDPIADPIGRLGDTILVNGTHDPHLNITSDRTRLRLLNASGARTYDFMFDDNRSFQLIGTDGGLLNQPVDLQNIQLSPGERAEIVVELKAGETSVLRSVEPDLGVNRWDARFTGAHDSFDIIELRAATTLSRNDPIPNRLAPEPIEQPDVDNAAIRQFELSGIEINGQRMDMSRIDFRIELDTTEVWQLTNPTGTPHNFHVHDTRFTVLDIDGDPPPPTWQGWKDTIYVPPGTTVRIAVRFTDYTDPTLPYMFHCHILRHEDQGMMGQFVVLEP